MDVIPPDIEAVMRATAAELEARIEDCHMEVDCPRCCMPVGRRCVRARPGGGRAYPLRELKHPHRERWTRVVPAR